MTTLSQLVSPHLNKTASEIVDILNAKTVQIIDNQKYTWAGLSLKFGTVTVAGMRTLLVAVPEVGPLITEILTSTGIDFSLEESQTMLTSLEPVLGAERVLALKSIGISNISPYQEAGFQGDVSEEDVSEVLADLIQRRDAGAYWSRVLAVVNPMIDAGNSADEIKTAAFEVT